ncbi:hypothetical protein VKS41_006565 [Umbelopsis sp. WA50703]
MSGIDASKKPEEIKVNKYNATELKHAVDDHLRKFLSNDLEYTESHQHIDVKLALGYLSCIFAAVATYYEWKVKFEKAKPVTLVCVVAYFILNTVAWAYALFVEKDEVFLGSKNGMTVTVSTKLKKHSQDYKIVFKLKDQSGKTGEYTLEGKFGNWFNEDGVLVPPALEKDLKYSIDEVVSVTKKD